MSIKCGRGLKRLWASVDINQRCVPVRASRAFNGSYSGCWRVVEITSKVRNLGRAAGAIFQVAATAVQQVVKPGVGLGQACQEGGGQQACDYKCSHRVQPGGALASPITRASVQW